MCGTSRLIFAWSVPFITAMLALAGCSGTPHKEKPIPSKDRNGHLEACGETCQFTNSGVQGKYFDYVTKFINCTKIFKEAPTEWMVHPPPKKGDISDLMLMDYSFNGSIPIGDFYMNSYSLNVGTTTWSEAGIVGQEYLVEIEAEAISPE